MRSCVAPMKLEFAWRWAQTAADIIWMVLKESMVLVAVGLAIGLPASWAAAKLIRNQLFGLSPSDPLTLLAAVTLLTCRGPPGRLSAREKSVARESAGGAAGTNSCVRGRGADRVRELQLCVRLAKKVASRLERMVRLCKVAESTAKHTECQDRGCTLKQSC